MKKIIYKFLLICILMVLVVNKFNITEIYAADNNFSFTGPNQASSGETLTYTITASGLTGPVSLSGSNITILSGNPTWVENNTVTVTVKVNGFPASVTATPGKLALNDEIDENGNHKNVTPSPITVEINEKIEQQPEQGGNTNPDPGTTDPGTSGGETGSGSDTTIPVDSGTPTPPAQTEPEQPKSNNNYLRSLKVDQGTLTPAFSREREDYTIEFAEDFDFSTLEKINVSATVENNKARANGTGSITVKEGENIIEVNVMAEDQSVRTYRITFIKPEVIKQSDLRLKGLIVKAVDEEEKTEDVELDPKFDAEVFDYKLEVKDNIEKLQIDAQVERDDIIVAIEGADKLHSGKNLIKITLTSPTDENVKSVYQITVDKDKAIVASTNPTDGVLSAENRTKLIIGIVLGIIVILAITLAVLLVINHKKNKQEQAGSEDDEDYDRFNKKKDKEELEEKKQKLFDYEEEKSYLTDENLEKLSEEYKETVKDIDNEDLGKEVKHQIIGDELEAKEKAENDETEEVADNMDYEEENKNSSYDKLAELLERKEYTSLNEKEEEKTEDESSDEEEKTFSKEDFLNDIKNKKGKHF